jgi:hypothetical protein
MSVSEFKQRELAFLHKDRTLPPLRGYQITNSKNLTELQKILKISILPYNQYVTIATYSTLPRLPINPKQHWSKFKEWVKTRDQTITSIDFMLDFDTTATINGIIKAWVDVTLAKTMLKTLIGKNAKYLTIWFSGQKGFHILGKCKIGSNWGQTAQEIITKQKDIALQLSLLCPSIDTTIYDTARLRKLLGSYVYSDGFGKTRVIPIANEQEFAELLNGLKTNNINNYFENKEITRINYIKLKL